MLLRDRLDVHTPRVRSGAVYDDAASTSPMQQSAQLKARFEMPAVALRIAELRNEIDMEYTRVLLDYHVGRHKVIYLLSRLAGPHGAVVRELQMAGQTAMRVDWLPSAHTYFASIHPIRRLYVDTSLLHKAQSLAALNWRRLPALITQRSKNDITHPGTLQSRSAAPPSSLWRDRL